MQVHTHCFAYFPISMVYEPIKHTYTTHITQHTHTHTQTLRRRSWIAIGTAVPIVVIIIIILRCLPALAHHTQAIAIALDDGGRRVLCNHRDHTWRGGAWHIRHLRACSAVELQDLLHKLRLKGTDVHGCKVKGKDNVDGSSRNDVRAAYGWWWWWWWWKRGDDAGGDWAACQRTVGIWHQRDVRENSCGIAGIGTRATADRVCAVHLEAPRDIGWDGQTAVGDGDDAVGVTEWAFYGSTFAEKSLV